MLDEGEEHVKSACHPSWDGGSCRVNAAAPGGTGGDSAPRNGRKDVARGAALRIERKRLKKSPATWPRRCKRRCRRGHGRAPGGWGRCAAGAGAGKEYRVAGRRHRERAEATRAAGSAAGGAAESAGVGTAATATRAAVSEFYVGLRARARQHPSPSLTPLEAWLDGTPGLARG